MSSLGLLAAAASGPAAASSSGRQAQVDVLSARGRLRLASCGSGPLAPAGGRRAPPLAAACAGGAAAPAALLPCWRGQAAALRIGLQHGPAAGRSARLPLLRPRASASDSSSSSSGSGESSTASGSSGSATGGSGSGSEPPAERQAPQPQPPKSSEWLELTRDGLQLGRPCFCAGARCPAPLCRHAVPVTAAPRPPQLLVLLVLLAVSPRHQAQDSAAAARRCARPPARPAPAACLAVGAHSWPRWHLRWLVRVAALESSH